MTDLELQKEDLISSYEQQLRDSHRALVEVQEAYKEKLRKCQAWEKVPTVCSGLVFTHDVSISFPAGIQQYQKPAPRIQFACQPSGAALAPRAGHAAERRCEGFDVWSRIHDTSANGSDGHKVRCLHF